MSYQSPYGSEYPGSEPDQPYNDSPSQLPPIPTYTQARRQAYTDGQWTAIRRRHHRPGLLITFLLVFMIGAILAYTHFLSHNVTPGSSAATDLTNIPVSTHPTLIIDSNTYTETYRDAPFVRVHVGNTQNTIVLRPTHVQTVAFDETGDKSTVTVNMDTIDGNSLDVTVPTVTDLKIQTNSATIDVNGVTGQMILVSNGGAITVTHSTVSGPALFDNNTGTITANHNIFSGAMTFNSNQGAIHALQNSLSGQVMFKSNSGAITFNGSMAVPGNYQFISNSGTINCSLPASTPLHIDATTINSSINSDIAGAQVQDKELHLDIGQSPRASVTLSDDTGSITVTIQKGR